jgi:hypothetical protein
MDHHRLLVRPRTTTRRRIQSQARSRMAFLSSTMAQLSSTRARLSSIPARLGSRLAQLSLSKRQRNDPCQRPTATRNPNRPNRPSAARRVLQRTLSPSRNKRLLGRRRRKSQSEIRPSLRWWQHRSQARQCQHRGGRRPTPLLQNRPILHHRLFPRRL